MFLNFSAFAQTNVDTSFFDLNNIVDSILKYSESEQIVLFKNAGFDGFFAQNILGLLVQAVPDIGVEHQKIVFIAVAPDRDIRLDFQNAGGVGDAEAVLLAVDGSLLQGGEDFAPVQGRGQPMIVLSVPR